MLNTALGDSDTIRSQAPPLPLVLADSLRRVAAADVVVMGNVLHDWDVDIKKMLVSKAYDAVAPGGVFIAIENVIGDDRRQNALGLLMSLNMAIETPGGFDYAGAQFDEWATAAGFTHTEVVPLAGSSSAVTAYRA